MNVTNIAFRLVEMWSCIAALIVGATHARPLSVPLILIAGFVIGKRWAASMPDDEVFAP